LQSGVEKLLVWAAIGIKPTTLDLYSRSGDYDLSAKVTPSFLGKALVGKIRQSWLKKVILANERAVCKKAFD